MRFQDNKPKAVWTHVEDKTVGDQRYSFYLSDGGAVKLTRHSPKGEQMVTCIPAANLEDIIAVQDTLPRVLEAFTSAQPEIQKTKDLKKAQASLDRQKQAELNRAILQAQAAKDAAKLAEARIEALTGKRLVG